MFDMLTPDVLTMLGSSAVGFIFKQQAEKRKNEQERMKLALQAQKLQMILQIMQLRELALMQVN